MNFLEKLLLFGLGVGIANADAPKKIVLNPGEYNSKAGLHNLVTVSPMIDLTSKAAGVNSGNLNGNFALADKRYFHVADSLGLAPQDLVTLIVGEDGVTTLRFGTGPNAYEEKINLKPSLIQNDVPKQPLSPGALTVGERYKLSNLTLAELTKADATDFQTIVCNNYSSIDTMMLNNSGNRVRFGGLSFIDESTNAVKVQFESGVKWQSTKLIDIANTSGIEADSSLSFDQKDAVYRTLASQFLIENYGSDLPEDIRSSLSDSVTVVRDTTNQTLVDITLKTKISSKGIRSRDGHIVLNQDDEYFLGRDSDGSYSGVVASDTLKSLLRLYSGNLETQKVFDSKVKPLLDSLLNQFESYNSLLESSLSDEELKEKLKDFQKFNLSQKDYDLIQSTLGDDVAVNANALADDYNAGLKKLNRKVNRSTPEILTSKPTTGWSIRSGNNWGRSVWTPSDNLVALGVQSANYDVAQPIFGLVHTSQPDTLYGLVFTTHKGLLSTVGGNSNSADNNDITGIVGLNLNYGLIKAGFGVEANMSQFAGNVNGIGRSGMDMDLLLIGNAGVGSLATYLQAVFGALNTDFKGAKEFYFMGGEGNVKFPNGLEFNLEYLRQFFNSDLGVGMNGDGAKWSIMVGKQNLIGPLGASFGYGRDNASFNTTSGTTERNHEQVYIVLNLRR
jgi:hypothetical protein